MERQFTLKPVAIGRTSRRRVWLMRHILRPLSWILLRFITRAAGVNLQIRLSGPVRREASGQSIRYRVLKGAQGYVIGRPDPHAGVLLYLHGGGFMLPALPSVHLGFVARLCRDLGVGAFVPDYRLAPLHRFPAALDDCENAYRALLDMGFAPGRILLAGESAGGNLVLGLLQRIRRHGLPMPSSAVSISPVTEMARAHAPPSRTAKAKQDPMISVWLLQRMLQDYAGGLDGSDPELSPIRADFTGFPPLYLLASEPEILLDDTLIVAERAREDGVHVKCEIWPILPHAFPLLEGAFREAREARSDIAEFMRMHRDKDVQKQAANTAATTAEPA